MTAPETKLFFLPLPRAWKLLAGELPEFRPMTFNPATQEAPRQEPATFRREWDAEIGCSK